MNNPYRAILIGGTILATVLAAETCHALPSTTLHRLCAPEAMAGEKLICKTYITGMSEGLRFATGYAASALDVAPSRTALACIPAGTLTEDIAQIVWYVLETEPDLMSVAAEYSVPQILQRAYPCAHTSL